MTNTSLVARLRMWGTGAHVGIEKDCALATDEIDRLSRIEIKYNNLCGVLNEQTKEIARLKAALNELLEQIDLLDGIEYSRDTARYKAEASWDDAVDRAREAAR